MRYSLCMMGDFQNGLTSPIFSVFWSSFFLQNNFKRFEECNLTCFLEF